MNKQFSWPDKHWNWPIQINHKHGIRCGSMIWVGGQVDLNEKGEVQNVGDLSTQTKTAWRTLVEYWMTLNANFLTWSYCFVSMSTMGH